ncbi:MAG: glycoside hydrolase family 32 protein [Acutalibacter sp.]|jgi:beta-fructofuranosidase
MKKSYKAECNGYSNVQKEPLCATTLDGLTVSIRFTPYTYESALSGLLCAFEKDLCQGLAISIGKGGVVSVKLGLGTQVVTLQSLVRHLDYQKPNVITVGFWGETGWCDLCVNGQLSNRKQFARHSQLHLPEGTCYVGRYVDGQEYTEDFPRGVFHGFLDWIEWELSYTPWKQVVEDQMKVPRDPSPIDLYAAQDAHSDPAHPVFHLMPPAKWMNEPHAPLWYDGLYHIFYQANPHAPIWDNLCWGHLVSSDMVHWKDAGIALSPDQGAPENQPGVDRDGCWSGSAYLDEQGLPVIFYTAGNNQQFPNQFVAVARPADCSDPELREWKKEGVVLRQEDGCGFLGEFRDPFLFRREDSWFLLVGTGDAQNGGGNAMLYRSETLRDFKPVGFITDYDFSACPGVGHVWELPVLLPLRDESGNHVCDILTFCACQIESDVVEVYYFLGHFDSHQGVFRKLHDTPRLLDWGKGVFTGGCGFVTPDKRSVFFTIAQGCRGTKEEVRAGWAHNGGLPVELSFCKGELCVRPIRELDAYFTPAGIHEGCDVTAELPSLEGRVRVTCSGNTAELILRCGNSARRILFDRSSGELWAEFADGRPISRPMSRDQRVDLGDDPIEMECYLDHSMIEVYLNHKASITLRNYTLGDTYRVRAVGDVPLCLAVETYRPKEDTAMTN